MVTTKSTTYIYIYLNMQIHKNKNKWSKKYFKMNIYILERKSILTENICRRNQNEQIYLWENIKIVQCLYINAIEKHVHCDILPNNIHVHFDFYKYFLLILISFFKKYLFILIMFSFLKFIIRMYQESRSRERER